MPLPVELGRGLRLPCGSVCGGISVFDVGMETMFDCGGPWA